MTVSPDIRASETARVIVPIADLRSTPDGPRVRQMLFGDPLTILESDNGWHHVQAEKDGYSGYVTAADLGPPEPATHWISAPSTHAYDAANMKSPDRLALSFGSRINVLSVSDGFAETSAGYVPDAHITPIGTHMKDPLDVAPLFLGTPYLWGGNSRFGIDCSGLVQASYLACNRPCPGDSYQQETALGTELAPGTLPERGDLMFWKGHVAMVADSDTLLHANAHHMAVSFEPLRPALERIEKQGDGKVTSHRRP